MKKIEEIFADYLEGKISDQDLLEFYEENPGAKEEFDELKRLFLDLPTSKSNVKVSKKADQNFYKQLNQFSERKGKFRMWDMLKYAAVLVLVAGAYFLGKSKQVVPEVITLEKQVDIEKPVYITKTDTIRIVEQVNIGPQKVLAEEKQPETIENDISEIRQQLLEINAIQNRMILAMIRQESASGRIQAINESQSLEQVDPMLVSALFDALENDPNANVRLAAVDAIGRLNFTTSLRENLVSVLGSQTDPFIQLELINQLIEIKEIKALPVFADIINNPNTVESIRNRAELGINILTQY